MKYWEIIADRLRKTGWSLGRTSALDIEGRTIWIVDAHRDDGRRFIVRAANRLDTEGEILSSFSVYEKGSGTSPYHTRQRWVHA